MVERGRKLQSSRYWESHKKVKVIDEPERLDTIKEAAMLRVQTPHSGIYHGATKLPQNRMSFNVMLRQVRKRCANANGVGKNLSEARLGLTRINA